MSESIGLEVEDVDLFQFVDVAFKIRVRMVDHNTGMVKTGQMSTIKVLLGFEGNTTADTRCREHHPHLLEVVSNTGIQENGTGTIEVKITDVSMNHDHQRFVIYLEAYRTHGDNNILLATTNPITSVRHKLVITESNSQPYIWYKDEGAKDKCIKVIVKLVDANKNQVKDRIVPLAVSLVYSSGQTVQPASVLSLFHDKDKPVTITSNGSEVIKFRVNEVSRNHRKQLFHLLVAPDTGLDLSMGDISPATSVAFEVKSKRTSDARKEQAYMRSGEEDDGTDVIPLPQSRLNELSSVQPLKRVKLEHNTGGSSNGGSVANSGNNPLGVAGNALLGMNGSAAGAAGLLAGMGGMGGGANVAGMFPMGMLSTNNSSGAGSGGMGGMMSGSGFPGSSSGNNANGGNSLLMGRAGAGVGAAGGLMHPMGGLAGNMMGGVRGMMMGGGNGIPPGMMGMFPGLAGMGGGLRGDEFPDDLSYEIPFKAIYSLAEWTNVAVNTLSAVSLVLNNLEHHNLHNDPFLGNAVEIQQSIVQLVETYPGRAHSCLQYLQQFLTLQETRAMQQIQMLAMMQQEHQTFRVQLDSLHPQRGTSGTPGANNSTNTGNTSLNSVNNNTNGSNNMNHGPQQPLSVQPTGSLTTNNNSTLRGLAPLSIPNSSGMGMNTNGLNNSNNSGGNGSNTSNSSYLLNQQQQFQFQQQQQLQQQQQQQSMLSAANLLSRGMRRDSGTPTNHHQQQQNINGAMGMAGNGVLGGTSTINLINQINHGITSTAAPHVNVVGDSNQAFAPSPASFQKPPVARSQQQQQQQQMQMQMQQHQMMMSGMTDDMTGSNNNNRGAASGGSEELNGIHLMSMAAGRLAQQQQQQMVDTDNQTQLAAAAILDISHTNNHHNISSNNTGATLHTVTTADTLEDSVLSNNSNVNKGSNSNNSNISGLTVSPEDDVTHILGKRLFVISSPTNAAGVGGRGRQLLGIPALTNNGGGQLRLAGFYGESGLGSSGHSSTSNGKDWVFRPLSALDCCRDPEKAQSLCNQVLALWERPQTKQNGLRFDSAAYDYHLSALKFSVALVLHELEENEVSIDHEIVL